MAQQFLYNEFPLFLKRYFPYKVQKISLNAGFTCPNRDGTKGQGDVLIAITRLLIRNIAGQRKRLRYSWKRENVSLPINILR